MPKQKNCNGYSYAGYHYGEFNISYIIDASALAQPGLESLIVQAAAAWSDTVIHSASGQTQVINLQRNGTPASGRPSCTDLSTRPGGVAANVAGRFVYAEDGSTRDYIVCWIEIYDTGKT